MSSEKKGVKHRFWLLVRYIGYITISFLWPAIFLPFCRLVAVFGRPLFGFVFLVYPATISQIRACVPLWYRNIKATPSVVGIMCKSKKGKRGLVMAVPWTIDELERKNKFLEASVKKIERVAKFIGADSVALGGRMVTVLFQRGYQFELPIVQGDKGAIYTISTVIRHVLKSANLNPEQVEIGILGYGFLGSRLGAFLKNYHNIVGVDPRFTHLQKQSKIRLTPNPFEIANCDLIVVLTPKGEQIRDEIQYFKPGAIVIDDTYPSLPKSLISAIEKRGGQVVRAVVQLESVRFWPKLPNWGVDWIPGCCIEAIVVAIFGDIGNRTQEEFNNLADQIGFEVLEENRGPLK